MKRKRSRPAVIPTRPSNRRRDLDHLYTLIHRLKLIEREVILLYLEGLDAAAIGDVTGLSAANVATWARHPG